MINQIENPYNVQNLTIKEERDLYHSIVNANLDAVIVIDTNGIVIEWNNASEQIYLFKREEMIGKNILIIIPDRLKDIHSKGMNVYNETGNGPIIGKKIETEAIDKNGRVFPIELSVSPIKFRGNIFFTSRSREITDRKRYETQILITSKELAHREKNALAIISAISRQIGRYSRDIGDFLSKFDSWLQSYKKTHEILARDIVSGMSLMERVRIEFAPYNNGKNILIEGDDCLLNRHSALNFGLCLHETVTNSVKHGALSRDSGKIHFKSVIDNVNVTLYWNEEGGPIPKTEMTYGFGSQLIRHAWIQGLHGSFKNEFPSSGFKGIAWFPIKGNIFTNDR